MAIRARVEGNAAPRQLLGVGLSVSVRTFVHTFMTLD